MTVIRLALVFGALVATTGFADDPEKDLAPPPATKPAIARGKNFKEKNRDRKEDRKLEAEPDGAFVGVIVENGKERRFTDQAEFDKAQQRMLGKRPFGKNQGRRFGSNDAFTGVLNINGKRTEFRNREAYEKARKKMMGDLFGQMRGFGNQNGESFDGESAENETGLVLHVSNEEHVAKLWQQIHDLIDGKIAGAAISPDVKAAFAKEEVSLEFMATQDIAAIRELVFRLLKNAVDANGDAPVVGENAVVFKANSAGDAASLSQVLNRILRRSASDQKQKDGPIQVIVTQQKITVRIEDPSAYKKAKQLLKERE